MTCQELDAAMKQMAWTGQDLAKRLSVSEKAVSNWRTGKKPVPGPVAAFVTTSLRVKVLMSEMKKAIG